MQCYNFSPLSVYYTMNDSCRTFGLLTHYAYLYSNCFLITVSFPVQYLLIDDAYLFVLVEPLFVCV